MLLNEFAEEQRHSAGRHGESLAAPIPDSR